MFVMKPNKHRISYYDDISINLFLVFKSQIGGQIYHQRQHIDQGNSLTSGHREDFQFCLVFKFEHMNT